MKKARNFGKKLAGGLEDRRQQLPSRTENGQNTQGKEKREGGLGQRDRAQLPLSSVSHSSCGAAERTLAGEKHALPWSS